MLKLTLWTGEYGNVRLIYNAPTREECAELFRADYGESFKEPDCDLFKSGAYTGTVCSDLHINLRPDLYWVESSIYGTAMNAFVSALTGFDDNFRLLSTPEMDKEWRNAKGLFPRFTHGHTGEVVYGIKSNDPIWDYVKTSTGHICVDCANYGDLGWADYNYVMAAWPNIDNIKLTCLSCARHIPSDKDKCARCEKTRWPEEYARPLDIIFHKNGMQEIICIDCVTEEEQDLFPNFGL